MRQQVSYRGRVQGVGFRATTRQIADGFRVVGWVRNEPDGSVLLEAQGEVAEVEGFLGAVRRTLGPFIRSEQASGLTDVDDESGFEIRH